MADTYTTNLNLTKPEPGAAEDTWGISLNADLDSLDAIFSSSGTQINLNPNQVNFADNKKAIFGTGSDLQIFHDGTNSHVRDQGTGDILISASDKLIIRDTTDGAQVAVFDTDGAVSLNYGNSTKLATTSTGIDVTGRATADGLTSEGTLGNWEIQDNGYIQTFSRAGVNYIRATNASGSLRFDTGGTTIRQKIASNGDISFYDDTGTTQGFFWDSSAESLGIGTTSPDYALDIRDDSNIQLKVSSTTTTNNARMVYAINNVAKWNHGVQASDSSFTFYDIVNNLSPFKIEQGAATNTLVVDSNSRVGIGTNSPNTPLHVKSSLDYITRFESTDTTAGIVLQDSSSTSRVTNTSGHLILSADISNEVSNSAIRFMLDTSSNASADAAMVVKSTGLGIGIPSPNSGSKLHIRGFDGASGASTNVAADEVFIENNGNVGITLGTPNTGTGYYAFADSDVALRGGIFYDHSADAMGFRVASAEKARIDSSGNLLVSTTDNSPVGNNVAGGIALLSNGSGQFSRDGGTPLLINRKTSDGELLRFNKDGATVGNIGCPDGANGSQLVIAAGGGGTNTGVGLRFTSFTVQNIIPCYDDGSSADNLIDLGNSGARFDDIYATNGTIQTSDRNEKQDIQALTDAETRVATACKGLLRRYKFNSAVAEKGDDARYHFGVIAQDLQDAFTAEGLDAGDYGMFISSTWEDDDGVEQTRLGVRYNELLAFIIAAI